MISMGTSCARISASVCLGASSTMGPAKGCLGGGGAVCTAAPPSPFGLRLFLRAIGDALFLLRLRPARTTSPTPRAEAPRPPLGSTRKPSGVGGVGRQPSPHALNMVPAAAKRMCREFESGSLYVDKAKTWRGARSKQRSPRFVRVHRRLGCSTASKLSPCRCQEEFFFLIYTVCSYARSL